MNASRRALIYYCVPLLFCAAVHWLAFKTWFYSDDFAWLGLNLRIHSSHDLLLVLFHPEAQGTVRTFSERLFFLVFSSVFGLAAPAFRAWVFLTQFANLILLIQIARRLSGSAGVGLLAGMIWTANAGLALALSWTSAYNEIASAFCFLLAFRLLLLYADTGLRKYWIWQWVVYLLGFGVLEVNVVYPALAAGYALLCARPFFRKTLYLFIPAIAFTVLHFWLVPPSTDLAYRMYFGTNILVTLWDYWAFAWGSVRGAQIDWRPLWLGRSLALAITAALAVFTVRKWRRSDNAPLFLALWFFVALLPFLPLKNHFTEYYVTVPMIGLAILAAWAAMTARWIAVPASLAALYFVLAITDIHTADKFYYESARKIKHLMNAMEAMPPGAKDKVVLVSGVDNHFYGLAFYADPFRLIGFKRVYLAPGEESKLDLHPEWGTASRFVIARDDVLPMIRRNEVILLRMEGTTIQDATRGYLAEAARQFVLSHPAFVNVGEPLQSGSLGPTWYGIERGFRWMPGSATLTIAAPDKPEERLTVTGYCPLIVTKEGPARVSFQAGGYDLGTRELEKDKEAMFTFQFPLPSELVGPKTMEVTIHTSRTVRVNGDVRPLGLVFGTFSVGR